MTLTTRLINAIRARPDAAPKTGQVVFPRPADSIRDYPSAGLTPRKLIAILKEADDGSLSAAMQLFEEMEEKDPHLFAVANTRRIALTGMRWRVISAADVRGGVDRARADQAADYCRDVLSRLESFDDALQHLALAIGRNLAVAEIVWTADGGPLRPADLIPVDFTRLVFDDLDRPRILTEDAPRDGIELPPDKFVVHTPHSVSGHAQRGGLLRVTAMAYLAKNLALKEWMIFAEIFGMPVRIARYEPQATAEEKSELIRMLESLGSNAAGVFSKAVDLQVLEANRGTVGPPYQHLLEFLNREISKAWLGQTLTTDISGQQGSFAAASVHEFVRQDILAGDIRGEGRTIRRQLLAPMTRFRFGPDAPVPFFQRQPDTAKDPGELAGVLDVAVNQLGLRVPESWTRQMLGIPEASDTDRLLPGDRT